MTSRRTLLDMISEAGGLLDDAAPFAVVTRQPANAGEARETLRIDLDALLYGDRPDLNIEITHGDLIHIPRDRPVFVYVNGAVNQPGEFETPRSRPLTLLQAIAKAGGTTDRAAVRKVQLLRRKDDGSQETISIDLKAVMRGELEDPILQSGDVVVVQETYF
jgi:polysaccharide export outer membrane protein